MIIEITVKTYKIKTNILTMIEKKSMLNLTLDCVPDIIFRTTVEVQSFFLKKKYTKIETTKYISTNIITNSIMNNIDQLILSCSDLDVKIYREEFNNVIVILYMTSNRLAPKICNSFEIKILVKRGKLKIMDGHTHNI